MRKKLYALDKDSGKKLWDFEAADKITAPINIVDSILYVGSWDKNFYAFSTETGKKTMGISNRKFYKKFSFSYFRNCLRRFWNESLCFSIINYD